MQKPEVELSVLIVNYNTAHLLEELFQTLYAALDGVSHQVIVVDNASRDQSCDQLRQHHPEVELIANSTNVGFGRANNQAIPRLKGRWVLLLNTDAFVSPDTIRRALAHAQAHPDVGVLGVRLLSRDGSLQPSCRYFPTPLNVFALRTGLQKLLPGLQMIDEMGWDHLGARDCDWVPGCFYLMPRDVVDTVGLFDPRYFLYYEEVDHCRSVKAAGWRVRYLGEVSTVHIGGESAKSDATLTAQGRQISTLLVESELLYFRKQHGLAGLALHLLLTVVAASVLSLKHLIKGRGASLVRAEWRNVRQLAQSLHQTRWGNMPTR